jgi:cobalt-zinc-cadmium efflux system membrane fusion protein
MKILAYMFAALLSLSAWGGCQTSGVEEEAPEAAAPADTFSLPAGSPLWARIRSGSLETRAFPGEIACNALVDAPPQSKASVSVPIGGYVREIGPIPGDYLRRGAQVAVLEHPDYLHLQEQYLEASNQAQFLQQEYERQLSLRSAEAGVQRSLDKAHTDLRSAQLRAAALREELALLGIRADSLRPETLSARVRVYAPISGYVVSTPVNLGKYVEPQSPILEIIDPGHMHLELQVFEKDASRLRSGQQITALIDGKEAEGYIKTLGRTIDPETRTLSVHAHLREEGIPLRPGALLPVRIHTDADPQAALPEGAFVSDGVRTYIYMRMGGRTFRRVAVNPGAAQAGFRALPEGLPPGLPGEVLIEGAGLLHQAHIQSPLP